MRFVLLLIGLTHAAKLPAKPLGHVWKPQAQPTLVLDLFVDMQCPYSRKMMDTLRTVMPIAEKAHPGKILWRLLNTPQPFHANTWNMHLSALAMCRISPQQCWDGHQMLFDVQTRFFNGATANQTRTEIIDVLATICSARVPEKDWRNAIDGEPDNSHSLTISDELIEYTKFHRKRGVHVTPTVNLNGLEAEDVSSSWYPAEWQQWLSRMLGEANPLEL